MVLVKSQEHENTGNHPFLVGQVINRIISEGNQVRFRIQLYHCVRTDVSSPALIPLQAWEPTYAGNGFKIMEVGMDQIQSTFSELVEGQFLPQSVRRMWLSEVQPRTTRFSTRQANQSTESEASTLVVNSDENEIDSDVDEPADFLPVEEDENDFLDSSEDEDESRLRRRNQEREAELNSFMSGVPVVSLIRGREGYFY